MTNRQKYIALPVAFLMMPFILMGIIGGFFFTYVRAGFRILEDGNEMITNWMAK